MSLTSTQRISQLPDLDLVEMIAFAHEYKGNAVAEAMIEFERRELDADIHETLLAEVHDRRHMRNRDAEKYHRLIFWLQRKFKR
ncbi:MAG: hypothetical protein AAF587_36730 [Bacteroidota bacterium]